MFYLFLHDITSEDGKGVEVYDGSRDGKERGIETVKHAAMSRKDVSAVLNSKRSLEQAFHQIAQGPKDNYNESKANPSGNA